MSFKCLTAKEGQSCIRCGRVFAKNELVFVDKDGDAQCIETCWRTRPAKVIPFRQTTSARKPVSRPAARTPEPDAPIQRSPVLEKHTGLMTDILKKGIEELARGLRNDENDSLRLIGATRA